MNISKKIQELTYFRETLPFSSILMVLVLSEFLNSEVSTLILFILLLILYFRRKYDSRILIGAALFCLVACPLFLIANNEKVAEKIAIYAYYFLVVGVIKQFVEYIREDKKEK